MASKKAKHFLKDDPNWGFKQPHMFVRSQLVLEPKEGKSGVRTVSDGQTCREGVIHNFRTHLRGLACKVTQPGNGLSPTKLEKVADIELCDKRVQTPGSTFLSITRIGLNMDPKYVDTFIEVADALVGNVAVLMSTYRKPGTWWRTDASTCEKPSNGYPESVHWYGSDNIVLRHPVFLAIISGLYRQAGNLCAGGFGEQMLKSISRSEVEKALDDADRDRALANIKKIKDWLIVPPANGHDRYYPFPLGFWRRFLRLQRAIVRHGYDEVFQANLIDSWGLTNTDRSWGGVYDFWGGRGKDRNEQHFRILELGKPAGKSRSVQK